MFPEYKGTALQRPILKRAYAEAQRNDNYKANVATFWKDQGTAIKKSAAYRAVLAVCQYELLPAHYATDVAMIDRRIILDRGDARPFLICLRHSGSHLMGLNACDETEFIYRRDLFKAMHAPSIGDTYWYFHWDGIAISRTDKQDAETLIEATDPRRVKKGVVT